MIEKTVILVIDFLIAVFYWIVSAFLAFIFPQTTDAPVVSKWLIDFFILVLLIFGVNMLIHMLFFSYTKKRIDALQPFFESGDLTYFIEELYKLKKISENPVIRTACSINISASYSRLEDYQAALAELQSVKIQKLKDPLRSNYWLSYTALLFESGDYPAGLQMANEHAAEIEGLRTFEQLLPNIEILKLYERLSCGETKSLRADFEVLREKWADKMTPYQDDFSKFEMHLQRAEADSVRNRS